MSDSSTVPRFRTYYPDPSDMDRDQRAFYENLVRSLDRGNYPDVDGQISYLFAYTYHQLEEAVRRGFGWVQERLLELAEAYHHEPKFADYCFRWGLDCLIGQGAYERFLEVSEPDSPIGLGTHFANLRCNIAYQLDVPPTPFDVLALYSPELTAFTRRNLVPYRHVCESVLTDHETEHGPVLQWLLDAQDLPDGGYYHSLLQGAPIDQPRTPFDYWCFYAAREEAMQLRELARLAENRLRDKMDVPRIGEGWIAETELYRAIEEAFTQTRVVHHGRPPWLGRQHLDIWLPRWRIAVEYHGRQHFEPIEFFGGQEGFEATIRRDKRKARLCEEAGVTLLVATEDMATGEVIARVHELRRSTSRGG